MCDIMTLYRGPIVPAIIHIDSTVNIKSIFGKLYYLYPIKHFFGKIYWCKVLTKNRLDLNEIYDSKKIAKMIDQLCNENIDITVKKTLYDTYGNILYRGDYTEKSYIRFFDISTITGTHIGWEVYYSDLNNKAYLGSLEFVHKYIYKYKIKPMIINDMCNMGYSKTSYLFSWCGDQVANWQLGDTLKKNVGTLPAGFIIKNKYELEQVAKEWLDQI